MTVAKYLFFCAAAAMLAAGAPPAIYGSAYNGPGSAATLYSISPTTGAATKIGPIGFAQVGAMAFDSKGVLYGVGKSAGTWMLITVNTTTGAGTAVGSLGQPNLTAAEDMDFRPNDGKLFLLGATQNLNDTLYTINTTTGAATYIGAGQSSFSTDGDALSFNSANILYTANQQEMDVTSQTSGVRSFGLNLNYAAAFGTPSPRTNSMKFDRSTGMLWASVVSGSGPAGNNGVSSAVNSLGTIDTSTGNVAFVGSMPQGMDGLAIVQPVSTGPPPPQVTQVQNNYSYILPGMPNYGVAQGSIFDIFGTGLATATSPLQGVPLPKTLAGATVNITVNGTTTQAILYFASPTQIAAILPSATPVGTGQITVTVGGQTSQPAPITVVAGAFGMLTLNGVGSGPAAVFDVNYAYNLFTNAANPGDYLTLWGSGLGAIAGDETMAPTPTSLSTPIEVDIGGVSANVTYHGRSGYPGLDQIDVQVPEGVAGCYVSVVVKTGNFVSNFGTIAVATTGRVCAEPALSATAAQIQTIASKASFTLGNLMSINGQTSSFSANFYRLTPAQFIAFEPGGTASMGSCAVYQFTGTNQSVYNPIQPVALNAGPTISVSTPAASGLGTVSMSYQNGGYGVPGLAPAGSLKGTYTYTGTSGPDIGAFTSQITWPGGGGAFTFSAANNATSAVRSQGLTVTWPQPNASSPGEFIILTGMSSFGSGSATIGGEFFCSAPLAAGQFAIPPSVLMALPPTPASNPNASSLGVALVLKENFSAPMLDFGVNTYASAYGEQFTYQ